MALVAKVLHEEAGWFAVDKPAGVVVVPARGEAPESSLWRALEAERGETLFVVHRIDRGTSGVVAFARTAEAHRAWSTAFEKGRVEKVYLALTHGAPPAGEVRAALVEAERGRMRVAGPGEAGKPARSLVSVVRRWAEVALVEVAPRTGRTHQIRVHLAHLGHPILHDPLYGAPPASPLPIERLALHASRLVSPHELGGVEVSAPLPADFVATLKHLGVR